MFRFHLVELVEKLAVEAKYREQTKEQKVEPRILDLFGSRGHHNHIVSRRSEAALPPTAQPVPTRSPTYVLKPGARRYKPHPLEKCKK